MTLHEQFRDAIQRANWAALGAAPAGARDVSLQLHQIIIGPRGTGKTTAALNYAESLATEKLVRPGIVVALDCSAPASPAGFEAALAQAQGGVLILDQAQHLSRDFNGFDPIALLKGAMEDRAFVTVLVGETAGLEALLRDEPGLKRRINAPLHLTHRFSDHEIAAYHADLAEAARRAALTEAERAAEDEKNRSAAQWKEKREVEVAAPAAVRPMRPVRFTRKDAGA